MPRVDSEAILQIEHHAESRTLFVRFVDGDFYAYFDVTADVYEAFLAAESHGRFFQDHIRNRYPYRKVA